MKYYRIKYVTTAGAIVDASGSYASKDVAEYFVSKRRDFAAMKEITPLPRPDYAGGHSGITGITKEHKA
jgi:hypothetical protein